MTRHVLQRIVVAVGFGLGLSSACAGSSIVGAECRSDLSLCGGMCVDLSSDPLHCGACDNACGSDQVCVGGECIGPGADGGIGDASAGEAGVSHDASMDGAMSDADVGSDGGSTGPRCDVGELLCGEVCVRPDSDPMNCGGCGVGCDADQVCAGGSCESDCSAPRGICDGRCIDLRRDPYHCGECDVTCPTGVCAAGRCSGALAGHLVIVGHDYQESRAAMDRVAGNAVFLGRGLPVRVLVYEGDAVTASITGIDTAIDRLASDTGRSWTRAAALTSAEVPLLLADADVFVLYPQMNASDDVLADLGGAWARALSTFLSRGGVVVAFDGDSANAGTHTVLTYAGILDAGARTDVSRTVLTVTAPGDAVALGVPVRYRGERSTVRFDTSDGVAVVSDSRGPVVVHDTFLP